MPLYSDGMDPNRIPLRPIAIYLGIPIELLRRLGRLPGEPSGREDLSITAEQAITIINNLQRITRLSDDEKLELLKDWVLVYPTLSIDVIFHE